MRWGWLSSRPGTPDSDQRLESHLAALRSRRDEEAGSKLPVFPLSTASPNWSSACFPPPWRTRSAAVTCRSSLRCPSSSTPPTWVTTTPVASTSASSSTPKASGLDHVEFATLGYIDWSRYEGDPPAARRDHLRRHLHLPSRARAPLLPSQPDRPRDGHPLDRAVTKPGAVHRLRPAGAGRSCSIGLIPAR